MRTTSFIGLGIALAVSISTITGCSGDGNSSAAQPSERTVMAVALQTTVQDAATGLPISLTTPDKITVVVYGADADKVVDGEGASLYDAVNQFAGPLTSSNGIFTIYLKPGTPVPALMSLRLVASAKDFVTSSQNLEINSSDLNTDGTTTAINIPISLIKQSAPPPTVVAATTPITLTDGATPASVITTQTAESTVMVDGDLVSLGTATVSIPATTTVYADAARTVPLPEGTTSINVTYNNNDTGSSLAAFPGGLTTLQDPTGADLTSPATFISGGFASVEVTSTALDGTVTKAKTFDKPVTVTISIPKDTINPETGVAVSEGDTIPIWSYDTTTGEWSVMKLSDNTIIIGTLGALNNADNTYPVTFITDHLSYFNLDWFVDGQQGCDKAPITIIGAKGKPLYLEAYLLGKGWMHTWNLDADVADPATDNITYAPKNKRMRIDAYMGTNSPDSARKVGSVTVNNVCAGVTLDVTDGVNALSPTIIYANMDVKVREVCDLDSNVGRDVPSAGIYAISSGQPSVNATTGRTGVATLASLMAGKTYQIIVTNRDGQYKSRNYSVLASNNPRQEFNFTIACKPSGTTGSTGGTGGTGGTGINASFKRVKILKSRLIGECRDLSLVFRLVKGENGCLSAII